MRWPPELQQLRGHNNRVQSVAFSPDGSKIVSGSGDKTIRVWDASTGVEMLPPLQGHNNRVQSVAFSPDGSKIVSGSDDKTIRVWDASTGVEMLPPLQGHNDWVKSVAFSPDGSKIVSGSGDKTIRVWDASTGVEMLPPLQGHNDRVWSVAFSSDGSKIVSGSNDKPIRVWDASTGVEMLSVDTGVDKIIQSLNVVNTNTDDGQLSVLNMPIISFIDKWFTDTCTGYHLGGLPVETLYYGLQMYGSRFVAWTGDHKIVMGQLPIE